MIIQSGSNYTVSGTSITPAENFNGNLTVPVKVNDGSADSALFNLAVSVNPVNDAPVISGVRGSLATNEDTPLTLGTGNLNISDPDSSSFTLTVLNGTNYKVSGTTITPAKNFNGNLTVPVKTNDGEADSAEFKLTVSVMPVNDDPVISDIADRATDDDVPLTAEFVIGDIEIPPGNLVLSGNSSDPALVGSIEFSGSDKNRTVMVTPVPGMSGTAEITVTVTDENGGTAESLFAMNITAGAKIISPPMSIMLSDDRDGDGKVSPGDTLAYEILIANTGDRDAANVLYANDIPEHTMYVSESLSSNLGGFGNLQGLLTYDPDSDRIEWSGDIPIGAELEIFYEVTVGIGVSFGQVIANQGVVSYDSTGDGENDSEEQTDGDPDKPGSQPTEITVRSDSVVVTAAETIRNLEGFENLQGLPAANP